MACRLGSGTRSSSAPRATPSSSRRSCSRGWTEARSAAPTTGSAAADVPRRVAVPETVQDVIAARIDLLPSLEKHALQAAAVVGRAFWEGAVRELVGAASPAFGLLEERDFVRRRRRSSLADEREHVFKHELTRDVAYRSLTDLPARAAARGLRASGSSAATPEPARTRRCSRTTTPRRWRRRARGATDLGTREELRASAVRWLRIAAEQARDRSRDERRRGAVPAGGGPRAGRARAAPACGAPWPAPASRRSGWTPSATRSST